MTVDKRNLDTLPEPPGDDGLPIVGETIAFFTDPKFNQKRQAKYGKVYKTNIFGNSTVIMVGADANTFLFRNENNPLLSLSEIKK